ncbi:unnamed protein product [Schistosoma rodhaini]|uniref:Calpain catalytic domain-containing protein n=1 Tax=Schistosoma rodhaini TaxID=6188 RepID=A0AA85EW35_9TREM|nr:unnamed protein product [Schistosoma rodhaini]
MHEYIFAQFLHESISNQLIDMRRKKHNSDSETECNGVPLNYLDILKPTLTEKRVQFNLNIPCSITPKGYAKLHEKLTSPCIPHSKGKADSMADRVYRQIFLYCTNSLNDFTHSSKSETTYASPTAMRKLKISQYEIISAKMVEAQGLYQDPEFPANDASIGNMPHVSGRVEWKRPKDINPLAAFCTKSYSRFDVDQGALGDCWFASVMATVTKYPALMSNIIPPNQTFKGSGYTGAFVFNFWRFGEWVEVVVDDRIPVVKGTCNPVFIHSTDNSEFWSCLLEKAYAKLCGSYAHLTGGFQSEAMEDFTGGICTTLILNKKERPPNLLKMMEHYTKTCCVMGADVGGDKNKRREELGLIGSHAYSVTGVGKVNYMGKDVHLVRCRNPWGERHEWKGPWSDNSPEWKDVKSKDKRALQYKPKEDGEFWMSFQDFEDYFSLLEICHFGYSSLDCKDEIDKKKRCEEICFLGEWVANVNAGGSRDYPESFCTNPQYLFTIGTDNSGKVGKAHIIVGVMQEHRRFLYGADYLAIGFSIYEVSELQNTCLTPEELLCRKPLLTSDYIPRREVTLEADLFPGTFILIPSTYNSNQEARYICRVFSTVKMKQLELDEENSYEGFPKSTMDALQSMMLKELASLELNFKQLCNPVTEKINSRILGTILDQSNFGEYMDGFTEFPSNLCSSLISSASTNLTGQIDLEEYLYLLIDLKGWTLTFSKYDDRKGCVSWYKFRELLKSSGYKVSNRVFSVLAHRHIDHKRGHISFESYLHCMANLKFAFDVTSYHPKSDKNILMFNKEDYLRLSLST